MERLFAFPEINVFGKYMSPGYMVVVCQVLAPHPVSPPIPDHTIDPPTPTWTVSELEFILEFIGNTGNAAIL